MTSTRTRRALRVAGIGCAIVLLGALGIIGWVVLQVRAMDRPVVDDGVHPFRSEAKRERYLAHYDARAAAWPVPAREVLVETSWGSTFVRISGPEDGPPLVLLPGANATSLMYAPNVAAWSEGHRVFAVDNIFDFGRSVNIRNLTTPEDFVDWLDGLLDRLGLEHDVDLLGLSYGGWIASQYGLARPERLSKLVLVAPAATVAWFSGDFITYGVMCMIPHRSFTERMVRWALHDAAEGTPEQRRMVDEAVDNAWLGLRCFKLRPMVHPTVLTDDEWRSFEVPVLFLVGENEVIYSISGAEAIAKVNRVAPEIETELFSGCGHDITLVQAGRFNSRVLEFLHR
ncbi:MAG: alpha/beta hydrolase [Candidatus Sulfomarinibacteraceae bacterium]